MGATEAADPDRAVELSAVRAAIAATGAAVTLHGDGATTTGVVDITMDSRHVPRRSLFCCVPGDRFDGHDFAPDAVAAGASALLVERILPIDVAQIVTSDVRAVLGPAAAVVHADPSERIPTVGVTGTNGKTTVVQMVDAILRHERGPATVVGTLHGARTTPEAPDLQRTIAQAVVAQRSAVVMEVSSHALALHRVDGTSFDVVAFTNLGRDHLDLHGSQEEYFRAKSSLFERRFARRAVICVDDPHGRLLADTITARDDDERLEVVEITRSDLAEVEVAPGRHGYRWRDVSVDVPIGGDVNVANSHVALEIAVALGIRPADAAAGIAGLDVVPGRFEVVDAPEADESGIAVVVDYAHTPDALDAVLVAARAAVADGARVIAVFGCAGDRDRDKRPEMGEVGSRLADVAFVTSDNPRTEDPRSIVEEVAAGAGEGYRDRVRPVVDRRDAIAAALGEARRGDIVVIAGKGHETYQDFGDRVIDFDDRAVVRQLLSAAEQGSPCSPS